MASVAGETETPGNCDPHVGEESQSHVSTCSSRVCFLRGNVSFLCGKKEVIEERKPATRVKMCRDANFT